MQKIFLLYIEEATDQMKTLLEKHNIKVIYMPIRKVQEIVQSARVSKEGIAYGIYHIPLYLAANR